MKMTELSNDDMLELLDWRIGSDVWRREWMRLHDAPPATGWVNPTDAWIEWARELVSRPENHSGYGRKSVARILTAAEALHPKGFLRPSLEQALLVVGSMTGESYEPAKVYIDHAVDNNVIRIGEMRHLAARHAVGFRAPLPLPTHAARQVADQAELHARAIPGDSPGVRARARAVRDPSAHADNRVLRAVEAVRCAMEATG